MGGPDGLTFWRWKTIEVGVVVIGVVPDGPVRGRHGVDEELVLRFRVKFADPAMRERAEFVFHATSGREGDTVAGLSWEGLGTALDSLLVGGRKLCWCCHVVVLRSVKGVNGCPRRYRIRLKLNQEVSERGLERESPIICGVRTIMFPLGLGTS